MISNIIRKNINIFKCLVSKQKISIKKDLELRNFIFRKLIKINFDKKKLKKNSSRI